MNTSSSSSDLSAAKTVIVLPARYGSSRFPGKPLAPIRGRDARAKPLIQWSYESACSVQNVDAVIVSTDDDRITSVVEGFGGTVLTTPGSCLNGTERVAACLDRLPAAELVINFQGDALLTPPSFVIALIAHMHSNPQADVGTVAVRCSAKTFQHLAEDARNGRVGGTTVVLDEKDNALYFSKRILPYIPDGQELPANVPILLHLGLYAYRRGALTAYVSSKPTILENAEGLEQLRFLHTGTSVNVLTLDELDYPIVEVNNPSDVPLVEAILASRS